jgi:hypothetical protein
MSGGRSQGDLSTTAVLTSEAYPEQSTGGPQTHNFPNPPETVFRPEAQDLGRPTLAAGQNHQSVSSISQLHVPGEFPRVNSEAREALGGNAPA